MRRVAGRLGLGRFDCPVITVGGTNGKGSCVALLEAMLRAQGYRVCAYTSPHLLSYNERVRVAGLEASDARLCAAFSQVEAVRDDVPLTYFEFGTLAALAIFRDSDPQAVLLEVGLGGRLDAVNLVDADLALVSSIGIDHTEWLGSDRDSIGREKAGICRPGRPAVCGDPDPPEGFLRQAGQTGARLFRFGQDFSCRARQPGADWEWQGLGASVGPLPRPALPGEIQLRNAAACIAGLKLLEPELPLREESIREGLRNARLPGRFQQIDGRVPVILDVAHNAEACSVLLANLRAQPCDGRTLAVLGMLQDKPAADIAGIMDAGVHAWYLGGLQAGLRSQAAEALAGKLGPVSGSLSCHADIGAAFAAAERDAGPGDRIVVFGSFHTVEAMLRKAG